MKACVFSKSEAQVYVDLDWYQYAVPTFRNAIVAQLLSGMTESNKDIDLLMHAYPEATAAFPKKFIDELTTEAYNIVNSEIVIIGISKFTLIKDNQYVIDGFKRLLTYLFEKAIHFSTDFRSSDKPTLVFYDGAEAGYKLIEHKLINDRPDEFVEAAMYKPKEEE